jgi:hypothetical protein
VSAHHQHADDVTSAGHAIALGADYVMSFAAWCELADVSLSTAKRMCAAGRGPSITRMSTGRKGVRFSDHHAWLDEHGDLKNETRSARHRARSNLRKGAPGNTSRSSATTRRGLLGGSTSRALTENIPFQPPTQTEAPNVSVRSTGDDDAGEPSFGQPKAPEPGKRRRRLCPQPKATLAFTSPSASGK